MDIEITNLAKAEIFVQCFQHIKTFSDSINITFNNEQMFIQCMDSSMILIMEFRLPASWFDKYEVDVPIVIGLSTNIWTRVLHIRDKSQTIHLNTRDKPDYVSVFFHTDESTSIFDKSFEVPTIQLDTELLEIPAMEHSAEFSLPSGTLGSMVNQLKQFGDIVHIECTEDHIQMISESEEYGKMKTSIPIEDLEEYTIDEGGIVHSSFGIKTIHNVCAFQKVGKTFQLGISNEYPMKLQIMMENDATLVFYVAPRMNE
jgi:proliferating cell nuclear antigen PCNA